MKLNFYNSKKYIIDLPLYILLLMLQRKGFESVGTFVFFATGSIVECTSANA